MEDLVRSFYKVPISFYLANYLSPTENKTYSRHKHTGMMIVAIYLAIYLHISIPVYDHQIYITVVIQKLLQV